MELSSCSISGKGNSEKILCISGNVSPEKVSHISESNIPCSKNGGKNSLLKCFLYFRKWEFLAPNLKNSYI